MFKRHRIAGMLLGVFVLSAGAHAAPMTFTTTFSAEPPAVSDGTGEATVVLDLVEMTLAIDLWFSGLTGTTTVSHIHCCTALPGQGNAGVATTLPSFVGFPAGVQAGTFSTLLDLSDGASWNFAFVTNNGGTLESATAVLGTALLAGTAYLNIHTSAFAGGEIRGWLTAAVPEPGTLGLVCLGLAGMMLRRRRIAPAAASG